MKSELVPNLLFANCYLFQVHLLICFSCEWAALGRACFRAQVRMIMVHTTPPPPCLAGLRNSLDKNIWKYKCTVCKIHLADTVKNHWAFRKIVEAYTLKTTFKILVKSQGIFKWEWRRALPIKLTFFASVFSVCVAIVFEVRILYYLQLAGAQMHCNLGANAGWGEGDW